MGLKSFDLWYNEAINDYESALILFGSKKFSNSVFYFVQSAEKAIKALLYLLDTKPWGHALVKLLEIYEEIARAVDAEIKNLANELERHYITSRYPDVSPGIPPKDAYLMEDAQKINIKTKKIIEFVDQEILYLKKNFNITQ